MRRVTLPHLQWGMKGESNQISAWLERADAAGYCVKKLAKMLGSSPRHLRRLIRGATGKSAHNWLNELRQTRAIELLRSGLSAKEVASKLGYKQVSHFSRDFKRFYKVPPSRLLAWLSASDKSKSALDNSFPFQFDFDFGQLATDQTKRPPLGSPRGESAS